MNDPATRHDSVPWTLVAPDPTSPIWLDAGLTPYATEPVAVRNTRDLHGDGRVPRQAWTLPAADPWQPWADLTGVPCPVCGAPLRGAEAGGVPGARRCAGKHGHYFVGGPDEPLVRSPRMERR